MEGYASAHLQRRDNTAEAAGAQPDKLCRARLFRQAPTSAEAMLWQGLRRRLVAGFKFRRQHVLAGYVVDFYCPALRLVIEVDGGIHDAQRERDEQRTVHLARLGARVLRIPNACVLSDLGIAGGVNFGLKQVPDQTVSWQDYVSWIR